jgi:hypothetical protein
VILIITAGIDHQVIVQARREIISHAHIIITKKKNIFLSREYVLSEL